MLHHWDLVFRLFVAAGLGSLIGAERERLVWAPGLRTHMLVCVGACLFMVVSAYGFRDVTGTGIVLDPSRVAAQVVSGIGFLGAGSILLRGDIVRGLTTAASLWTVAAIGLAVGGGLYLESFAATVVILLILVGIKPLENWYQRKSGTQTIRIVARQGAMSMTALNNALDYHGDRITRYVSVAASEPGFEEIEVTVNRLSSDAAGRAVAKLKSLSDVRDAEKL